MRLGVTSGVVEHGDRRGRTLGFPTANLPLPDATNDVDDGVYAGWALRDSGERWPAAISVGRRTTIYGRSGVRLLEAHLLGFDDDLYGEVLTVELVAHVRPQQRFDSLEALALQLRSDVVSVGALLEAATLDADPQAEQTPSSRSGA